MSKAGQFREQIALLVPAAEPVSDGAGGFLATAETEVPLWARVQRQAGSEQLRLGAIQGGQPYKVTLRYYPGVRRDYRLRFEGKSLSITSIVHNERKTETLLYCYDNG